MQNLDEADRVQGQQMELILRQLESLPTLPAVATRLLNLTTSSKTQTQEIIHLIKADQSLTAKILSLAARADSGIRKEARTVEKVVLMLGFEAVRAAVLSIKVFETFGPRTMRVGGIDRAEFWKHCLAVASAAEMLARRLHLPIDSQEVFTCGLLHDLGKLALEQCLPKSYARVAEAANQHCGNIADYERLIIGVDHAIVGRRLAQQWHLPALVEQTIWLHHQPIEAIPEILHGRKVIALVHLADTLVRELRFGYSGNFVLTETSADLAGQLGVNPAMLKQVAAELPAAIEQRAEVLGLGKMTSEALYREALAAANAELGRLNEKFRRRAADLSSQAQAFALLREFGSNLSSTMSLSALCQQLTEIWTKAIGVAASAAEPVAAYLFPSAESTVVAAAKLGQDMPQVIVLARPESFLPQQAAVPPAGASSEAVLPQMIANVDRWASWIGPATLEHRALVCGNNWVGGLFYPAGLSQTPPAELTDAVAMAMGFAAAAVESRDSANALAEQLAQSTQKLYATQQTLAETRTLAAVGEMAAGAAHEMNNPLAVVVGRAQLMAESAAPGDRQTWKTIADQGQRISDIVTELMEFARPAAPKPEPVEIADLVASARQAIATVPSAKDMALDVSVPTPLPKVNVDMGQMTRVLVELLANAAEAQGTNPQARIEAERDDISGEVLLKVIDRGSGMDSVTVDRAFTPFFSAKPAGRKRGMGLSKARRLVQLAGGKIWIRSAVGQGTTVFVQLPRAEESAQDRSGEREI